MLLKPTYDKISINFSYFFLKLYLFSSSFWSSGWATRPPGEGPGYATEPTWLVWRNLDVLFKNQPITNASFSCPCESYQGGLPAVYIVLFVDCSTLAGTLLVDLLRALFFTGVPEMDDGGVLLDPMLLSLNASSLQKFKKKALKRAIPYEKWHFWNLEKFKWFQKYNCYIYTFSIKLKSSLLSFIWGVLQWFLKVFTIFFL